MATAEELISAAYKLRRSGDPSASERCYRDAAQVARDHGSWELRAHALRHFAEFAAERGASEIAIAAADEALQIYRNDPSTSLLNIANASRVRALALESCGRADEAKQEWRAAGELFEKLGVTAGVAEASARASKD